MSKVDVEWMRRALGLAARGARGAAPNPMVGAVVVKDGECVGEGYHRRAGEPHAEVVALRDAGESARGATAYVTLEPCCHQGRTGPCTEALSAAGVARVVVGVIDPFPQVAGKGVKRLRRARIKVEIGVLEAECRRQNEAFFCRVEQGRPFVTLKLATTLDGRIATRTGDSKWITGEATRAWVHELRAQVGAILVGMGTVEADDPHLTARPPDETDLRQPLRVVLDREGRLAGDERICRTVDEGPVLHVVGPERGHEIPGVERFVGYAEGQLDWDVLFGELVRRDVNHLLVEGGSRIAGQFHDARLVDRYLFCIAPRIVGDPAAIPALSARPVALMADALSLAEVEVLRTSPDLIITGVPVRKGPCSPESSKK